MAKFNTADRAAITREEFVERLRAWAPGKLKVMAAQAGTIPYELTCAVSKRVPRVYLQNGQVTERELLLRF